MPQLSFSARVTVRGAEEPCRLARASASCRFQVGSHRGHWPFGQLPAPVCPAAHPVRLPATKGSQKDFARAVDRWHPTMIAAVKARSPAKGEPELLPLVTNTASSAAKTRPRWQLATSYLPGAKALKQLAAAVVLLFVCANVWWASGWLRSNSYKWDDRALLQVATNDSHSRDGCAKVSRRAEGCAEAFGKRPPSK